MIQYGTEYQNLKHTFMFVTFRLTHVTFSYTQTLYHKNESTFSGLSYRARIVSDMGGKPPNQEGGSFHMLA